MRKAPKKTEVKLDDNLELDLVIPASVDIMEDYGGFLNKRRAERNKDIARDTDMSALDVDDLCDQL